MSLVYQTLQKKFRSAKLIFFSDWKQKCSAYNTYSGAKKELHSYLNEDLYNCVSPKIVLVKVELLNARYFSVGRKVIWCYLDVIFDDNMQLITKSKKFMVTYTL